MEGSWPIFFVFGLTDPLIAAACVGAGLIGRSWLWAVITALAFAAGFILLAAPRTGSQVWIGTCLAAPIWALVAFQGKRLFQS